MSFGNLAKACAGGRRSVRCGVGVIFLSEGPECGSYDFLIGVRRYTQGRIVISLLQN